MFLLGLQVESPIKTKIPLLWGSPDPHPPYLSPSSQPKAQSSALWKLQQPPNLWLLRSSSQPILYLTVWLITQTRNQSSSLCCLRCLWEASPRASTAWPSLPHASTPRPFTPATVASQLLQYSTKLPPSSEPHAYFSRWMDHSSTTGAFSHFGPWFKLRILHRPSKGTFLKFGKIYIAKFITLTIWSVQFSDIWHTHILAIFTSGIAIIFLNWTSVFI